MAGRGLPVELFLSLRYLRARGQRANLSLFVWIGVGGVFLGVSALIVVLAVMTGFQDGIKEKIIAANPHILVVDPSGRGIEDGPGVAARVQPVPGVRSATPFVLQQALFTGQRGGATGGLLRGVDLASPALDVPVKNTRWELYLPPDYGYSRFGGTMTREAGAAPVGTPDGCPPESKAEGPGTGRQGQHQADGEGEGKVGVRSAPRQDGALQGAGGEDAVGNHVAGEQPRHRHGEGAGDAVAHRTVFHAVKSMQAECLAICKSPHST